MDLARRMDRAEGPASVLAIGTAVPANVFYQKDYPDFFFGVTNSNHMTELKSKFQRMCEKSCITKRHFHLTEEMLKENPRMCGHLETSLDARQEMVVEEVPRLGMEAALKAMEEWGQAKSSITHLVFATSTTIDMPGADLVLTKLLGLRSSIKRVMLYMQGCYGGANALRVAKDLAENNKDARVLVVCAEICAITFRGPSAGHLDNLVGHAIFGDGAAAVIVGSDPVLGVERACFQLHDAQSNIFPDSASAIRCHIKELGLYVHLHKDIPSIISTSIASFLSDALRTLPLPPPSFNDLFWIVQPGGRAILDHLQLGLQLHNDKLSCTRHILSQYGNMLSCSVLFVMDEMRSRSLQHKLATTGQGAEWGLLVGLGPGITCETLLLKSLPANS